MASVKKSVLMEYLQCTLCMEDMQRSCILQCHHSFCVDCLQKYMTQASDPQKMTCPTCRKITTLPDGDLTNLPPNFFMDNLKELISKETDGDEDEMKVTASADQQVVICSLEDCQGEAITYCTNDQEYLCQTCTDEHAAGRFTKKHQTISAAEAKCKVTSSTKSHHPCGRHPNQMLDMYCKTCEEIICYQCCYTAHSDHDFNTLRPFIKPCEERLDTLLKRIDKLQKSVDVARQTSQKQVDKAQQHIGSLKTQVTSTFKKIREKLAQQEERLKSDLDRAATRVDKVASSIQDEQQLAAVNLESLRFLGQSLKENDVYDQMSNLPILEEAVEKRWRKEIPGVIWKVELDQGQKKINMSNVDHFTLTETSHTTHVLPCLDDDTGRDGMSHQEGGAVSVTAAVSGKPDKYALEQNCIARFCVSRNVYGLCIHNNLIFLIEYDNSLYLYNCNGDLMKTHAVDGMKFSYDVLMMTHDGVDKLIITSHYPHCLYYIPVQSATETCTLGTAQQKLLNYWPWGLCLNHNNNLVVTDPNKESLHVHNSSGDESNTIKLPSGGAPRYLTSETS